MIIGTTKVLKNYKHMEILSILGSIFVGIAAGTLHGFAFFQRNLTPSTSQGKSFKELRKRQFVASFLFAFVKITLIAALLFYILHTESMNIILVMLSFLISFWFVILSKRGHRYGRF